MDKINIDYPKLMERTTSVLGSYGALLVANDASGRPNVMTIGWATFGIVWSRPMMCVLVRPSRYTYRFMEQSDSFTVCLPPPELADAAMFCGTHSGRDVDKFKEAHLTPVRGKIVSASYIEECTAHFECRIVHKNYVLPQHLDTAVNRDCYANGDYHVIYYGEIAGAFANPE